MAVIEELLDAIVVMLLAYRPQLWRRATAASFVIPGHREAVDPESRGT